MPNLTTPFLKLSGKSTENDLKQIEDWSVSLIDELKSILCNLDSGNVTEAGSVKAQNIDCTKARIKGAQIQSLTADKLTAGTIDTGEITVKGESDDGGTMIMTGESLVFYEKCNDETGKTVDALRIALGRNDKGIYIFTVQSADGHSGIYMDENGEVFFTGTVSTTKNAEIGTNIVVGKNSSTGRIDFAGMINSSEGSIELVDHNMEIKADYINLVGKVSINGIPVDL